MFKSTNRPSAAVPVNAPPSPTETEHQDGVERATFAAGCFWGVEAAFREIEGVVKTRVGYTGGHTRNPTYGTVCSHTTGHAEAVEVWFNPVLVSYEQLLDTFWQVHHPQPSGLGYRRPVSVGHLRPRCRPGGAGHGVT